MNYYNEIKNKIIDNEIFEKVKDYSKERNTIITYFEIGRLLNEAGGKYGDNIIDEYSKKLVIEVGKKYNRRTLFRMKQFYNVFSKNKTENKFSATLPHGKAFLLLRTKLVLHRPVSDGRHPIIFR